MKASTTARSRQPLVIDAGRWGELVLHDPLGRGVEFITKANSGHYATLVEVMRAFSADLRGLGRCRFEAGFYVNIGTMKKGLVKRVARHLTRNKKLGVWHVDRLTTAEAAMPVGCVLVPWAVWTEHTLSDAVGERLGLVTPIPGFSSRDCKASCRSHLWYSSSSITLDQLAAAVGGVIAARTSWWKISAPSALTSPRST